MTLTLGRFGVWAGAWPSIARSAWTAAAPEIEQLGFGTVWLGAADGDLELAEALLAATSTLVVGTSIVNIWTQPAEKVLAAYARIAPRFADRFVLGVGSGHAVMVERLTDQKYVKPYSRLMEYLDALDAGTPPVPAGRRALAALGPRTVAASGKRSAGALPYLTVPEHTHEAREILGDGPLLAPEHKVVLETDPVRARALGRVALSRYLQLPNYTNNLKRFGFTDDDFAGGGSDRLVDALVAWGDVDTVVARLHEHLDAGADHVAVQAVHPAYGEANTLPLAEWRILGAALNG